MPDRMILAGVTGDGKGHKHTSESCPDQQLPSRLLESPDNGFVRSCNAKE